MVLVAIAPLDARLAFADSACDAIADIEPHQHDGTQAQAHMATTLQPRPKAIPEVQVDTDRLLVPKCSFASGAETGWPQHGMGYAVVPLIDGMLLIEGQTSNQTLNW
jgi:hypothetical protein